VNEVRYGIFRSHIDRLQWTMMTKVVRACFFVVRSVVDTLLMEGSGKRECLR